MQTESSLQVQSATRVQINGLSKSGILSFLPVKAIPFGELIRIDKPVGIIYLYTQCVSGTLLAVSLSEPVVKPSNLVATNIILFISSILFRSAGCSWNDAMDQAIDRKVSRTRLRPLARGAVSTTAAHVCTGCLLLAFFALQSQLPIMDLQEKPLLCVYYTTPFVVATGIYPFLKRVTHYPQLLLGFMNSWGLVLAFPALGLDIFSSQTRIAATSCIIISAIAWTAINDTIYAFQDVRDDQKAGVKSLAVRYESHAKILFGGIAFIQVSSLLLVGLIAEAGVQYFTGVLIVSCLLGVVIRDVDLEDPKDCA